MDRQIHKDMDRQSKLQEHSTDEVSESCFVNYSLHFWGVTFFKKLHVNQLFVSHSHPVKINGDLLKLVYNGIILNVSYWKQFFSYFLFGTNENGSIRLNWAQQMFKQTTVITSFAFIILSKPVVSKPLSQMLNTTSSYKNNRLVP